jgi:RNA polymerase sigma factor (sigma-70 family)
METNDDSYYIKQVINGQTQYFSFIVEKYQDIVFSIALKIMKNREDAEEMAQESFIKAYNSLQGFKGKARFSTWLYRITYNTCISETRKKKHYFISTDDVQVEGKGEEMHPDGIPEENRARYIAEAMKRLSEEEYMLVLLYYYEDQSVEDISKVTELSASNVKVKLYRARKKMAATLNDLLKDELHTIL